MAMGGRAQVVAATVGLACLWPCLEGFVTMRFRAAVALSGFALSSEWTSVVLCLAVLAVTLAVLAGRAAGLRPGGCAVRVAVAVTGAAGFAGHMVLALSGSLGALTTPLVLAGLVAAAAYIVVHLMAWGFRLARLEAAPALALVVGSYLLSYAVQAGLDALGGKILLYALVVCPAASAVCWLASGERDAEGGETPASTARAPAHPWRSLPWASAVPTWLLICFEEVFSRLLFLRHGGWPRDTLGITLVLCTAVCLAVLGILRAFRARGVQFALGASFVSVLVVYMGALLVTVLMPESSALVPERLLVAAGSSFRMLLLMALAAAACTGRTGPVPAFGAYCLLVLSVPLSSLVSFALDALGGAEVATQVARPSVIVPVAGMALFLIAALYVAATVRFPREAAGVPGAPQGDAGRDARIAGLAAERGCTARESEILALLCRGYSAKVVADRLGIAESTVVTHTTHLYRKFGVASKQELLAVVDGRTRTA